MKKFEREVSEFAAIIIHNWQDCTLVSLRVFFQNPKNVVYSSGVISEFSALGCNYISLPAYILVSLYSRKLFFFLFFFGKSILACGIKAHGEVWAKSLLGLKRPPVKTTNKNSSMHKHQSVNLRCKERRDTKSPPPQTLLGLGSPPVRDHREPFPRHLYFCFRLQEDFLVEVFHSKFIIIALRIEVRYPLLLRLILINLLFPILAGMSSL